MIAPPPPVSLSWRHEAWKEKKLRDRWNSMTRSEIVGRRQGSWRSRRSEELSVTTWLVQEVMKKFLAATWSGKR
jgi:hypothetical protein